MQGTSMLLTVGHALSRAKDQGMTVRMNVGGDWVTGVVVSSDGQGVALLEPNGELCVARHDAISCVRLPASASGGDQNRSSAPQTAPEPRRSLDYV